MTDFHPVTRENLRALCALDVRDDQRDFVAPTAVTIAQHHYEPGSSVLGIWQGGVPVGLMAMIHFGHPEAHTRLEDGSEPDMIYLWRLMIAAPHQGKGHGRAAMEHFLSLARASGQARAVLSVVDEPGSALPFYESLGFRRTGRVVHDEVVMEREI